LVLIYKNSIVKGFHQRWLGELLNVWTITFFLLAFVVSWNASRMAFYAVLFLFLLIALLRFIEAKRSINEIRIINNKIEIQFFEFNRSSSMFLDLRSVNTEVHQGTLGVSLSSRLYLKENGKTKITQYAVGNIKLNDLKEIDKRINTTREQRL
jgi:hypothetical protein